MKLDNKYTYKPLTRTEFRETLSYYEINSKLPKQYIPYGVAKFLIEQGFESQLTNFYTIK